MQKSITGILTTIFKKIMPPNFIQWIRNKRYSKSKSKFYGSTPDDTFKKIYETNYWGSSQSISGPGSEFNQAEYIITRINALVKQLEIKSILDIPCGDFNWMKHVDLSGLNYTGADIVDDLIVKNNSMYATDTKKFLKLNLISDPLPKSDLVITRDCLVHLSFDNIFESIKNIKNSGSTWFLTTTFPAHSANLNITTGDWMPLNLEKPPFNLPPPFLNFNECGDKGKGEYKDKSLALWKISDIPIEKH
jgi:2-polyprenyl-3-methyl-5-hydroxy-6-metoxy-1,4-benzoquinol methylase